MRTLLSLTLLLLGLGTSYETRAQQPTKTLQVEDVTSGKFYAYTAGRGMRSTSDGKYYTLMDDKHTAILRYSFHTGQLIDTLFSVAKARECEFKTFDDYILEPKGNHILIITDQEAVYRRSSKGNAFHYDVRRNRVEPLSSTSGKVMIPTFSPDGRMVAFVRDGNIFIKKFEYDTEVQVTSDAQQGDERHHRLGL